MHIREFDVAKLPANRKDTMWLDIASRADGGTWGLPLLYIAGIAAGPILVVTAGIHGDEYEGVEAIPNVYRQIEPTQLCGTLLMIPVCNMPAYAVAQRSSPIDSLNLARVFPGDIGGTITQRIAYWIRERLLRAADFYIDLHSGGVAAEIPTLTGYLHDDGELGGRSLAGAHAFGAPVLWGHPLPIAPGRTVSAATDLGVPWLYTEASGGGYAQSEDVACFTQGVINVMRWLTMLDGTPAPRPMSHHLFGDGDMDGIITSMVGGYFRAEVRLLESVTEGQRLGAVYDLFGQEIQTIHADQDGIVILLRRIHRVHVGDGLAHIANQFV